MTRFITLKNIIIIYFIIIIITIISISICLFPYFLDILNKQIL